MKQYDVVFLGSGHAAWHAALTLKQSGKQVAIVEKDTIAGTCTNYGCNAKILLEGPYEVLEEAKQYPNIIDSHNLEVNWKNLMRYKEQVINPMSETLTSMFEQQGIDVIMGKGKLVDAHTIEVNNTTLQSDYIVIATGQHSHQLDIEGKEYTHDSRDFLSMEDTPKSITFIGGGIISIEFASIMIKTGADVHAGTPAAMRPSARTRHAGGAGSGRRHLLPHVGVGRDLLRAVRRARGARCGGGAAGGRRRDFRRQLAVQVQGQQDQAQRDQGQQADHHREPLQSSAARPHPLVSRPSCGHASTGLRRRYAPHPRVSWLCALGAG